MREKMTTRKSVKRGRRFVKFNFSPSKRRARRHARRFVKNKLHTGEWDIIPPQYDDWGDW